MKAVFGDSFYFREKFLGRTPRMLTTLPIGK